MKNRAKYSKNNKKRKTIHTTWRRDSRTQISYIERIKHL
jgi:hypothetical protein